MITARHIQLEERGWVTVRRVGALVMREVARFPADRLSVSSARRWLSDVLAASGHDARVPDAELCLSELAANAVRHARTPFDVEVSDEEGWLMIAVRDENFRPVQAHDHVDPSDVAGRGLQIVNAVASTWGVIDHADDGKTVWFTLPDASEP